MNNKYTYLVIIFAMIPTLAFGELTITEAKSRGAMTVFYNEDAPIRPDRVLLKVNPTDAEAFFVETQVGKMVSLEVGDYVVNIEPNRSLPYVGEPRQVKINTDEHSDLKLPIRRLETQKIQFRLTDPEGKRIETSSATSFNRKYPAWRYTLRVNDNAEVTLLCPRNHSTYITFRPGLRRDLNPESIALKDITTDQTQPPYVYRFKRKESSGKLTLEFESHGKSSVAYYGQLVQEYSLVIAPAGKKRVEISDLIHVRSNTTSVDLFEMKPGIYAVTSVSVMIDEHRNMVHIHDEDPDEFEIDKDGMLKNELFVVKLPGWSVFPRGPHDIQLIRGGFSGEQIVVEFKVIGTDDPDLKADQTITKTAEFEGKERVSIRMPAGAYSVTIRTPDGKVLREPTEIVVNPRRLPNIEVLPSQER